MYIIELEVVFKYSTEDNDGDKPFTLVVPCVPSRWTGFKMSITDSDYLKLDRQIEVSGTRTTMVVGQLLKSNK